MSFLFKSFLEQVRSVLPLAALLIFIRVVVFRSPIESVKQLVTGLALTVIGFFLFQQGVEMSLKPMAELVGEGLVTLHRPYILLIALVIGLAATIVEPGLQIVAKEAETISVGAIPARLLIYITAFGFGSGMVIAVLKMMYNVRMASVLIPMLALAIVLSFFSDQTISALAFDCCSAATGPVNIPVNMMLALGLANKLDGVDPLTAGFGIVGMTSLGAAIAVLTFGVIRGGGIAAA